MISYVVVMTAIRRWNSTIFAKPGHKLGAVAAALRVTVADLTAIPDHEVQLSSSMTIPTTEAIAAMANMIPRTTLRGEPRKTVKYNAAQTIRKRPK